MTDIDTTSLVIIAVCLLLAALLLWFVLRGRNRGGAAPVDQAAPTQRQRIEPAKPQIDLATPVRFDPPPAPPALEPAGMAQAGDRPAIAAAVGAPDDLRRIKGLGPKLATLLASLGITRFDQIAAWTDADIAEVDRFLGTFKGRIVRDNWVEQARYLAAGDEAGFTARFGALGSGPVGR